jgi:hypothetical protein
VVIRLIATASIALVTRRRLVIGATVDAADLVPPWLPRRAGVLVGGGTHGWMAFDCPCNRGHRLLINLTSTRRPAWRLTGTHRAPTLYPSVDVINDGHRCHFWIRQGRVEWADSPSPRQGS